MNTSPWLTATISAVLFFAAQVQAAPYDGPMADAHAHLPSSVSPGFLADVYADAGIEDAVLFVGTSRGKKLKKIKKKLGRGFLLFVDVHKGKRGDYKVSDKRLEKLAFLYEEGRIHGIGEVYTSLSYAPFAQSGIRTPIRSAEELAYLEIANELGMPVHFHNETPDADFAETLKEFPNIKFVLSHSGYLSPWDLDKLMLEHENLYADLSLISNHYFGPFHKGSGPRIGRTPDDSWKEVLIKQQDRFMIGSDIGADADRVNWLPDIMKDYREMLGHLPEEAARKIAYDNFHRLFPR